MAFGFFLSGCSLPANPLTGTGSLRDVIHTASGIVIEVGKQTAATIELGKMGIEKAKETAQDVQERVESVQEGIDKLKQGKEMMEKAMAR